MIDFLEPDKELFVEARHRYDVQFLCRVSLSKQYHEVLNMASSSISRAVYRMNSLHHLLLLIL